MRPCAIPLGATKPTKMLKRLTPVINHFALRSDLLGRHIITPTTQYAPTFWQKPHAVTTQAVASTTKSYVSESDADEVSQQAKELDVTLKCIRQQVDYTTLCAAVTELKATIVPSRVEEVAQPDAHTLCLRLRTPLSQSWLHICWHHDNGRITLGRPPLRGAAAEAFSFATIASNALVGRILTDVTVPMAWERLASFSFSSRLGETASNNVHVEIMGRYSNAILTDGNASILAAGAQVSNAMSSLRQVQAGRRYSLPPPPPGISPDMAVDMQVWQATIQTAATLVLEQAIAHRNQPPSKPHKGSKSKAGNKNASVIAVQDMMSDIDGDDGVDGGSVGDGGEGGVALAVCMSRAFQGVSPPLVEEMCVRAEVPPTCTLSQLSPDDWVRLHQQWTSWLGCLKKSSFTASIDDLSGRYSVLGSFPRTAQSVCMLLDDHYGALQSSEAHSLLHARCVAVVANALKRLNNKVISFEKQMDSAAKVDALQKRADLITANLYRIKPGDASVEVDDWETGEKVVLQLETDKTAVEMIEGMYKKSRKLRRAVDAVLPLIEEAEAERSYLKEVEYCLSGLRTFSEAKDWRALQEVQEELVSGGYMKAGSEASLAAAGQAKGKKAEKKGVKSGQNNSEAQGYKRYESPNKFQVLVGRNTRQNDEISIKIAQPNDIWMHIRNMPGSHVLIRVPAGRTPADEDLQFAADLAAYFSKGQLENKADVIVAPGSAIRKPKGAKPGAVTVSKELRNIVARPSNSAAAKLAEQEQK